MNIARRMSNSNDSDSREMATDLAVALAASTVGSIICTAAMASGKSREDAMKLFIKWKDTMMMMKELPSAKELFNRAVSEMGGELNQDIAQMVVLLYDLNGVYSPMVSLMDSEGYIIPLQDNGICTGAAMEYNRVWKDYCEGTDDAPRNNPSAVVAEGLFDDDTMI